MDKGKILKGLGIAGAGIGVGYVIFQAYKHYKVDQEKAIKEAEEYIKDQEQKMKESDPLGEDEEDDEKKSNKAKLKEKWFEYGKDYVEEQEQKNNKIVKITDPTSAEEDWLNYIKTEDLAKPIVKFPILGNKTYNLTRGDEKLRYDADSIEAFDQYRSMILSDYEVDTNQHAVLDKLFNYTVSMTNRRDMILGERICEDRTRFFGKESKYIHNVTMAEIVVFYANKLSEDIGMDLTEAMKLILDAIELDLSTEEEHYEVTAMDLSRHCFWNSDDRYGLFGILEKEYDELYEFPEVAVTRDTNISYDMEYSVFMDHYADELIEEQLNGQR